MPIRTIIVAFMLISALAGGAPAAPHIVFVHDGGSGRAAAERCAEIWRDEGPALLEALAPAGAERTAAADTVRCFLLDSASFAEHFGGRMPDWGVGVALPDGRTIAIDHVRLPAVGRGLREVFLHEMVHALLFRHAGGVWLPTWLHEGAAMRHSGEWRFADTVTIALEGQVPDLSRLQGRFPVSAARADRAYRTSLLAVERLCRLHGEDAVARVVAAAARTGDFAAGFRSVTGETPDEFAADFAAAMRLRYGWLVMITRWPTLFVLLGLLLCVGALRKIVVSRRRLAAMEDPDAV